MKRWIEKGPVHQKLLGLILKATRMSESRFSVASAVIEIFKTKSATPDDPNNRYLMVIFCVKRVLPFPFDPQGEILLRKRKTWNSRGYLCVRKSLLKYFSVTGPSDS